MTDRLSKRDRLASGTQQGRKEVFVQQFDARISDDDLAAIVQVAG